MCVLSHSSLISVSCFPCCLQPSQGRTAREAEPVVTEYMGQGRRQAGLQKITSAGFLWEALQLVFHRMCHLSAACWKTPSGCKSSHCSCLISAWELEGTQGVFLCSGAMQGYVCGREFMLKWKELGPSAPNQQESKWHLISRWDPWGEGARAQSSRGEADPGDVDSWQCGCLVKR
jgi:hypothetical protein